MKIRKRINDIVCRAALALHGSAKYDLQYIAGNDHAEGHELLGHICVGSHSVREVQRYQKWL